MRRVQFVQQDRDASDAHSDPSPVMLVPPSTPERTSCESNPSVNLQRNARRADSQARAPGNYAGGSGIFLPLLQHAGVEREQVVLANPVQSSSNESKPIKVAAIKQKHLSDEEVLQKSVMKSRLDAASVLKQPRSSIGTKQSHSMVVDHCPLLGTPAHKSYSLNPQLLKPVAQSPLNAKKVIRPNPNPVTTWPISLIASQQFAEVAKTPGFSLSSNDQRPSSCTGTAGIIQPPPIPESADNVGLQFVPPGCELALQVYSTVCFILEEQEQANSSYQIDPNMPFPKHMLQYSPVPDRYFSVYNLRLCDGISSVSQPKASSWAESEKIEDVICRVTITESGALFKTPSKRFTHFITLKQFKSDLKAFILVRALTLFGNFRLVKTMQLWKREARSQVFNRHLETLSRSLRWHSPSLLSCIQFTHASIIQVQEKLERISLWKFNADCNLPAELALEDELPGNELQKCDRQIQAFILCCKTWFKLMVEDVASCVKTSSVDHLSMSNEPRSQFRLTSTLDMVRAMRHEESLNRLLPFVKVCSYMIESAKLQLCITTSRMISVNFSTSQDQGTQSLFSVKFFSGDDQLSSDSQSYTMYPSVESVCQWFGSRYSDLISCFQDSAILTSREDIVDVFIKRTVENRQARRSWVLSSDGFYNDFLLLMNQKCSENLNTTLPIIRNGMKGFEDMKLRIIEEPLECHAFLASVNLSEMRELFKSLFEESRLLFSDNLLQFNHLITRIFSCCKVIHRCFVDCSLVSIGWCTLNMVHFLRNLNEYASSRIQDVNSCISDCFDSAFYSSEEQLNMFHKDLSLREIDPEVFAQITSTVANAADRLYNLEELLLRLAKVLSMTCCCDVAMPFDLTPILERQNAHLEQIRLDIESCSEWHSVNFKSAVKFLTDEQQSISLAVQELRETLALSNASKSVAIGSQSDFQNVLASLEFFDGICSVLVVRGNNLQSHLNAILLPDDIMLSLPRPELHVSKLISDYKLVWTGSYKANEFWVKNCLIPIAAISLEAFREELVQLESIKSRCEESREILLIPVYETLTKVVGNTSNILPLARNFQSKTMNDSHWSLISRIVAVAYLRVWAIDSSATQGLGRMSAETETMDIQRGVALTLSECVSWDLCNSPVSQQIYEVVMESEVQSKLESSVQEHILKWTQMMFQFEVRDNKIIFSSLDSILDLLDESELALKSMLSSKFCKFVINECQSLLLNLSRVRAIVEVWSRLQELCLELHTVYCTAEFCTSCTRGFAIFERESRRWMSSLEVVANRPSVFYACGLYDLSGQVLEDTDIYDVKKEYAVSLHEGFQAARHEAFSYVHAKRLSWPRLFAVPTEMLMLAVSQPIPTRNSFWPQLFLSVFSSVEMVAIEKAVTYADSVSSSVTLSDRTKLSLNAVPNFCDKLELWLPKLHASISSRMFEGIRTILVEFGPKDSAFTATSLPPVHKAKGRSQIIGICDWAIWCSRISQVLPDSASRASGFGEKMVNSSHSIDMTFSHGQQRSVMKNLEAISACANAEIDSSSFHVSQPNVMIHHTMLQIQRIILCAWVRDVIRDIVSSSDHAIIDSHCWAWVSVVRYHVDNLESNFLTVRICDQVTDFGYEVIAHAAGYNMFPIVCMTDRMRLVCSLAASASACIPSTLVAPCASGKATIINLLASLYGRFVATLPCCSSLEITAVDMFTDLILHSSNVTTVCFIKDIDFLQLHVLSHLAASFRRINCIIAERARPGISTSLAPFWFVCCTMSSENIRNQKLSHLANTFSRTVRVIDIDRNAFIACVLRGFGFLSAGVVSLKLHVFFEQISASIQYSHISAHLSSLAVVTNVLHSVITAWNESRSERDANLRLNQSFSGESDLITREIQCVIQAVCQAIQPLLSALGNPIDVASMISMCFGIPYTSPSTTVPSSISFPSIFDQFRVFFHCLGVDCEHHLQTAIDLWNSMMNSVLPSPFLVFVGPDGSGRSFCLALCEILSIHFSHIRFQRFTVCSSQGSSERLLQFILEQVDRSPAVIHFDCASAEPNESERYLLKLSQLVPADISTWLIVFLQSCVLAQNCRSQNVFDRIKSSAKYVTIESGVTCIKQQTHTNFLYIIVSGSISLTSGDKSSNVGMGHIIGDFASIYGLQSTCSAVSSSKSSLIMVPAHVFCSSTAVGDSKVTVISKTSHCFIVTDAHKSVSFIECMLSNSDHSAYTTWGADNSSWQRNLKLNTSLVIKCNDLQHDSPSSLSRCAVVASPIVSSDSQISAALNWLRHHSFSASVGNSIFHYVSYLFQKHIDCCISFFLKLDNRSFNYSGFAKTAAQLLVCVCSSCSNEQGIFQIGSLTKCTCDSARFNSASSELFSVAASIKLPHIQKLRDENDFVKKCPFCKFPLHPALKAFVGDGRDLTSEFASIKLLWANMVAFCILHTVRGLLPSDCVVLNLFEKHAKNGFVDVIFRSASVFDWCISTTFPFMTSWGNSDMTIGNIGQSHDMVTWSSRLTGCNLVQEIFVPTNHTICATWLARCWLRSGFSSVIFDGRQGCAKSIVAKFVAESCVSDSSLYRQVTLRCAQNLFSKPLEYFLTRRSPISELPSHLKTIHVYSTLHAHSVLFVDDVQQMPQDIHMGIRSLQQLGVLWFLTLNRNGNSSIASLLNFPTSVVLTKNSSADRTAAINNFALTLSCCDFSNVDNLKSVYSALAKFGLQLTSISTPEIAELSVQIGNACSSLHQLLHGIELDFPYSRLISQCIQGVLECGDYLKTRKDAVRIFLHEILHGVFDRTSIPMLDSDNVTYLQPLSVSAPTAKLKSTSSLNFQLVFRTIASCFPRDDLKELEFVQMTRMFEAHSDEIALSAASRRSIYLEQNAASALSILQESASQLLSEDDCLRNCNRIDFMYQFGDFSDIDCSARNGYGFTLDATNILRIVRALRCRGSHIVVTNSNILQNHIIPIAVSHSGFQLFVLTSQSCSQYDRSDAISDLRQIFEAAVFFNSECVAVLSDLHLNCDTWEVFLSAIHWQDTVGHACFDEKWMLEKSRNFLDSGICGYTAEETIKNMKRRFVTNFHAIICISEETTRIMEPLTCLNSVYQVCLMQSTPTQYQVLVSTSIISWLQQFRWDHWISGLSLRALQNSYTGRILRDHRDTLHPGLSSRVVSVLSSLNIGNDRVLAVCVSPHIAEVRSCTERAITCLQCALQFLQWFLQVSSDTGMCPDYIPFSLPNDFSFMCISIFKICASIISQSGHAQTLKYNLFPLTCLVSQIINSVERQIIFCFNRLLQLEAAIRFSYECIVVRNALGPALETAQSHHTIATADLCKFEDDAAAASDSLNDSSSSSIDGNTRHAQLLAAAAQSANEVQRLSSMISFCESHTHISIEEMSSEASALMATTVRIVPDAALQQVLLMLGPVIEESRLFDLLSALIPIASSFDRQIRGNCKIEFPGLPQYSFEPIQLLSMHTLIKLSLSWNVQFSKLHCNYDDNQPSSSFNKEMPPSLISSTATKVSIKDLSAFIRIASVANHLGSGPKSLPILILDPQRIFQHALISLFSIDDVCITSVESGYSSLAFARSVLTAVRGGLCLVVQGFSCNPRMGFPRLLLNLIEKNFSSDGDEESLRLDPDTKALANVLGIPSTQDVPIHQNFCLILVCNGKDFLSPHHSSIFKVVSLDPSHRLLTGIVINSILQERKESFDKYVSFIKNLCSNLQLLKQSWEAIILDSAQASGNFSYGAFAYKAVSEDSIDAGWGNVIDVCLRDSNALINQESLKMRLQHKLHREQIALSMNEFLTVWEQLMVVSPTACDVAEMLVSSLKVCTNDCSFINLAACFDQIVCSTRQIQENCIKKTKIVVEKGQPQHVLTSLVQEISFDDEESPADAQKSARVSKFFSQMYWKNSQLESIKRDLLQFISASMTESQRFSFAIFCAWHQARAAGNVSEDEWLVLTCSDTHLEEAWVSTINLKPDIASISSASVITKNHQNLLSQTFARIKNRLFHPSVRQWIEALSTSDNITKLDKRLNNHVNLLPSDLSLHGICLIAARVYAPHLHCVCIQEFVNFYTSYPQVKALHQLDEKQLFAVCKSVQVTIVCTSLPHSCVKSTLIQLCPDCKSAETSRGCVHFSFFDCKLFQGFESSVTSDTSNTDSPDERFEVVGMSDFPLGRMRSALICAINDAVISGKGLIVLNATSFVPHWQGYLRHSASASSSSNSNQLSKLVLVCDTNIAASSLRTVSSWSRVVFWNFPMSCECLDAFGTGILWLSNELRQEALDSKKLKCEILSVGKVAVSFQERLLLRISTCLMSFAIALHTRSSVESGFWIGQQAFDAQLFFNHSVSVAVSMFNYTSFCATKAAFLTQGIPWLRHQVIFGCGAIEFASRRDIVQIIGIFDSLISSDIVNDEFALPFSEADVFPALSQASDITSLVASIAQRRNYAVDAVRMISQLKVSEWNRLQYVWTQGLLHSCFVRNYEENGDFNSPNLYYFKAEAMKLLLHIQVAFPSREAFSSLLDSDFKFESGCLSEQLLCAAVSETKLFVAALKQTSTRIQRMLENITRRSALSFEQEADLQFLMSNTTPLRWCKSFGFSKVMQIPKFINYITEVGSFWSSWPARPTLPPVLCAHAFRNFGRVLHFLALEQAFLSGCDHNEIKFVVVPDSKQSVGGMRVKGLTGRGFSWNGKVALLMADLQSSSEESPAQFRRQIAPSDLAKRSSNILLVPLAEVSICAMSPQVLRDCKPYSTATFLSMPILRDGCDLSEVDNAPCLSFLFNEPYNDNLIAIKYLDYRREKRGELEIQAARMPQGSGHQKQFAIFESMMPICGDCGVRNGGFDHPSLDA